MLSKLFDVRFLSQQQLSGFDQYKYSCNDPSSLATHISHAFWNWVVQFYPRWVAPNVLPLAGSIVPNLDTATSELNVPNMVWLELALVTLLGRLLVDGTGAEQATGRREWTDRSTVSSAEMEHEDKESESNVEQIQSTKETQTEQVADEFEQWKKQQERNMNALEKKVAQMEKKFEEEKDALSDQIKQLQNANRALLDKTDQLEKMAKEYHKNCWNVSACAVVLTISGHNNSIVQCLGNGFGHPTVFAKFSISSAAFFSDIFYFEIKVKQLNCWLAFGLAINPSSFVSNDIDLRTGVYSYINDGVFRIGNSAARGNYAYEFYSQDIVGCGVHLGTKRLFFTKNGRRLVAPIQTDPDVSFESTSSDIVDNFTIALDLPVDVFYPFVSLRNSGDKIEANFGPNFLFDLSTLFDEKELASNCQQNFWDVSACHSGLTISEQNFSIVQCGETYVSEFPTVFAKFSVSESAAALYSTFCYFEITVQQMKYPLIFGFAGKITVGKGLSYFSNGKISFYGALKEGNQFGIGDTVGCGVSLVNKRFFCTKNGRRIESANDLPLFSSTSADELFPFVTLSSADDKIEANFGPIFRCGHPSSLFPVEFMDE